MIGERPDPTPPDGWTRVAVKAASLNHHDLWTLRGVGIKAEQLPMILGCDAAGIDEATGAEVVVHAVINTPGWTGDDTLDPGRTLLSEKHQGSIADYVIVPARNVVPKPADLSWAEAACLSTAWLTAYRMLFTQAELKPGPVGAGAGRVGRRRDRLHRDGARGRAAGVRDRAHRGQAGNGARTRRPRVVRLRRPAARAGRCGDGDHRRGDLVASLKSLKPGGKLVVCGATSARIRRPT